MAEAALIKNSVRRLLDRWNSPVIRDLSWFGLSEIVGRVVRLVATVFVMRSLTASELGLAATAVTCFELIRVLSRNGVGQYVAQVTDSELKSACVAAYRLGWAATVVMAVAQIAVAFGLAAFTEHSETFWLIAALAITYLFMPAGLVQVALLIRSNKAKQLAIITSAQSIAEGILIALFAYHEMGAWAIVAPKVLTAPVWLFGVRYFQTWAPPPVESRRAKIGNMVRFSLPVLATEVTVVFRNNVDNLLVGVILGYQALGLYYFVFNAGLGLSLSATSALNNTVYPVLASAKRSGHSVKEALDAAIKTAVKPVLILIGLQAALAHLYVPVLFGERWKDAAWMVSVLCLSAVSKPVFDMACIFLRVDGRGRDELRYCIAVTCVTLTAFAVALTTSLPVAIVVLAVTSFTAQLAVSYYVLKQAKTVSLQ